jgi:hypothetical protein
MRDAPLDMHGRTLILLLTCAVLTWACDSPPPATRPREGAPPPTPGAQQVQAPMGHELDGAPTSAQQTAQGHWLRNHQLADMWSGPADEPSAVSFGEISSQFCVFEEREARGDRLYVFNPYSGNYFWIERAAVGPVGTPEIRPRAAKPADQNCADAVFDG